jgi:hypothetical protein
MTNLSRRTRAKIKKLLKGYLRSARAMTTIEKGVNGKRAAIMINAPPHLLAKPMYLASLLSLYAFTFGIPEIQLPIL